MLLLLLLKRGFKGFTLLTLLLLVLVTVMVTTSPFSAGAENEGPREISMSSKIKVLSSALCLSCLFESY